MSELMYADIWTLPPPPPPAPTGWNVQVGRTEYSFNYGEKLGWSLFSLTPLPTREAAVDVAAVLLRHGAEAVQIVPAFESKRQ